MQIHTNTGGPVATNGYLLVDESTHTAALIDAPKDTVASLLNIAKHHACNVPYLILTHGHWDHIADHAVYSAAFPQGQILIHPLDEPKLILPQSTLMRLPFAIPPRHADAHLHDGQTLAVGSLQLKVIHTPGHAPGHVCLHLASHHTLFAGDLLFARSIGRTDLPDSNPQHMQTSLERILLLPANTNVLAGHGPPTTLAQEIQSNPWLADR